MHIDLEKKLLFSMIPVVILVVSCEIALRLLPLDLDRSPMEIEYAGVHVTEGFAGMLTRNHFKRDEVTFWAPRPSVPPFNRLGYRGEVLPIAKESNEFRILAVGDSNTLGHGASWANLLPAALTNSGFDAGRVTVINAGVYGFTSHQGKLRLRKYLRYQPDLVLISFAGNEATLNGSSDREIAAARRSSRLSRFVRRSALVRFVDSLVLRIAVARARVQCLSKSEFAEYRDSLRKQIRTDQTLEDNLAGLRQRSLISQARGDRRWSFGEDDGEWSVEFLRDGVRQPDDGVRTGRGLVFGGAGAQMLLSFDGFEVSDGGGPYLLWIEGETGSDITVKISWATPQPGGFSPTNSSRAKQRASGLPVTFRSCEVLPAEVSRVRVSIRIKRPAGEVVVRAVRLVTLG